MNKILNSFSQQISPKSEIKRYKALQKVKSVFTYVFMLVILVAIGYVIIYPLMYLYDVPGKTGTMYVPVPKEWTTQSWTFTTGDNTVDDTYKYLAFNFYPTNKFNSDKHGTLYLDDIKIEKVIRIQKRKDFKYRTDYAAVINDTRYKIEQIQFDNNRNPAVAILSLSQRGLYEGEDYGF